MGWEPSERHDHYDAEGAFTGHTVVTREAEFDDFERDRLLALGLYEADVHTCGYHKDLIEDPTLRFTAEARTCEVCAGVDVTSRIIAAQDKRDEGYLTHRFGENVPPSERLPGDGRDIVTVIKTPPTSGD